MNDRGEACLCDFGLATVRYNGASLTSHLEGGTTRWMAPEQFQPESDFSNSDEDSNDVSYKATCSSDIWSFGMLCLELLTEERPFPDKILESAVILGLIQGELPKNPNRKARKYGLNNKLWKALHKCWSREPNLRLPLDSFRSLLVDLAQDWSPPIPDDRSKHITVSVWDLTQLC